MNWDGGDYFLVDWKEEQFNLIDPDDCNTLLDWFEDIKTVYSEGEGGDVITVLCETSWIHWRNFSSVQIIIDYFDTINY